MSNCSLCEWKCSEADAAEE